MHTYFLTILSQLIGGKRASVLVGDHVLQVEQQKEEEWVFSVRLSTYPKQEILSCFSSTGTFLFSQRDAILYYDPRREGIYVSQSFRIPEKKYIPFKQCLSSFLKRVSEYEEIFSL